MALIDEISKNCLGILQRLPNKKHIEQEARLGYFVKADFFPGVPKDYYYSCYNLLKSWNQTCPKESTSIAIYFSDGLRVEQFESGKIDIIRKQKVSDDIDFNLNKRLSMRISTSQEVPVKSFAIENEMVRFLKPKKLPKLFREGTLCKFKCGTQVRYNNELYNVDKGFNQLTWRSAHPDQLMSLFRNKVHMKLKKEQLRPDSIVEMICLSGEMLGKPIYAGKYTVQVHLANIVPLSCYSNVDPMPPYVPTAWRKKERTSFHLWDGMTIDLTKTIFSKKSIQSCFDGTGVVRYEMEADWDTLHKSTNEFAKAITAILCCSN